MKRAMMLVAAMLSSCDLCPAQDLNVCEFDRVAEVGDRTTTDTLRWYAGESVGYTVTARNAGEVVEIPDGTLPVCQVLDATNGPYIVTTGTVVSATNGQVRFWVPAPEANLPPGTYYSWATVYRGTNQVGVLERAIVRVTWRPGDTYTAASPLTNVLDQVLSWWADANAAIAEVEAKIPSTNAFATTNDIAAAVAAETAARTNAGYLTAEADAAALGAVEAASNALAQAIAAERTARTNAGYLTAEADEAALEAVAGVQSNLDAGVQVEAEGGSYNPDWFTLTTSPWAYSVDTYGPTTTLSSVVAQYRVANSSTGLRMVPDILRQSDWSGGMTYAALQNLTIRETNGYSVAEWEDGLDDGAIGRWTATLGGLTREYQATYSPGTLATNWWWLGDAPGSIRAMINTSTLARAGAAGAVQELYEAGAYTATNFVRRTNCWAAGIDLTCASPWNSHCVTNSGVVHNQLGNFHAGTAVTPQHILYSAHWPMPIGTTIRFVDATNGVHDRTLAAKRILPYDVAVGLLSSALPATITPAKILAAADKGVFRGYNGILFDSPGYRCIALDQAERAWVMRCELSTVGNTWDITAAIGGSTNDAFGRTRSVGGDSGNPIFLSIGTNTVLLATQWTPFGGPAIAAHRSAIEAAMVEMGGSAYTSLTTVVTGYDNYDALPVPGE